MDPLVNVVAQLGLGVASNAVYDAIKRLLLGGKQSADTVAEGLRSEFPALSIHGAKVLASTAIDVLAQRGDISITGSQLVARDTIWMRSAPGTKFEFGDGSASRTDKTSIDAGPGAKIIGQGGAGVRQNEDGSISFFT